jgi:hypothetical protein
LAPASMVAADGTALVDGRNAARSKSGPTPPSPGTGYCTCLPFAAARLSAPTPAASWCQVDKVDADACVAQLAAHLAFRI